MRQKQFIIILMLLMPFANAIGQKVPKHWYFIQSAQEYEQSNKGYWDVPDFPKKIEANEVQNIQVWEKDEFNDRKYTFTSKGGNSYHIKPGHGHATHYVKMEASFKKNGANIELQAVKGSNGSEDIFNRQLFSVKYVGAGRWKIYSDDGRVLSLENKSSKNGSNLQLWEDSKGAYNEWVFIEEVTGKAVYPEFPANLSTISHGGKISNPKMIEVLKEIDKTYLSLYNIEKLVFKEMENIRESSKTIGKSLSSVNNFDKVNTQISSLSTVLSLAGKIPILTAPVEAITSVLDKAGSVMDKSNDVLSKLGEDIIPPVDERFKKAKKTVYGQEAELAHAMNVLIKMKKVYIEGAIAVSSAPEANINKFVSHTSAMNQSLKNIKSVANSISTDFTNIQAMNKEITAISGTVNSFHNGTKSLANAIKSTQSAANTIDKIMNKKYTVGVAPLKKSISLEDALGGASISDFPYIGDWIDKLTDEMLKALKIKIPAVPGVSAFMTKMTNLKNTSQNVDKSNTQLLLHESKLFNATASLQAPFARSLSTIPFEQMQKSNLINYSVK